MPTLTGAIFSDVDFYERCDEMKLMMMMAMIELILILFNSFTSLEGTRHYLYLINPTSFSLSLSLSLSVSIAYALGPSVLLLLRNTRNEPVPCPVRLASSSGAHITLSITPFGTPLSQIKRQ